VHFWIGSFHKFTPPKNQVQVFLFRQRYSSWHIFRLFFSGIAVAIQPDQKKIQYKLHGNAIVDIDAPNAIYIGVPILIIMPISLTIIHHLHKYCIARSR
jgi:hypothetical protein